MQTPLTPGPAPEQVAAIRAFNRDYTRSAGLITDTLLDTPHSLTEARVVFEVDGEGETALADLRLRLDLDPGYLSRVVTCLERQGLLVKRRSPEDGRRQLLSLTTSGMEARETLDGRSAEQARALLEPMAPERRRRLVGAMGTVLDALGSRTGRPRIVLRAPGAGELGWIVERHGALYAREHGWGAPFEALVAGVIADFARAHPGAPDETAAWIADLDGRPAGSVLCLRDDARTARLRLLLVEPDARGHGIGALLVGECIRFARGTGYTELVLWTNEPLVHARPIYERAGFDLVAEEPHSRFGPEVVGQDWRLRL